jgi:hypothetical protein
VRTDPTEQVGVRDPAAWAPNAGNAAFAGFLRIRAKLVTHPVAEGMSVPVVIGSGLTGLSISHRLSRASIDHVLIGRRPDMSPRLGESLNLEGTLLAWEMFPQLSRFFFPKARVLGYLGAHEVICEFEVSRRLVSRLVFRDGLCSRH